MTDQSDFIIVGIDTVIDQAISRAVGFVEMLYSGEQLIEEAYRFFIEKKRTGVLPTHCGKYAGQTYTASNHDREYFRDVIYQLVSGIEAAVDRGYKAVYATRPIIDYAYRDYLIFLRLG